MGLFPLHSRAFACTLRILVWLRPLRLPYSVTKILKKTENKTEMAKKGMKFNINAHFFSEGGDENGKEVGLRAAKIRSFIFSWSLAVIGIVFVPLHYYYRISEKSTKEIQARMKF